MIFCLAAALLASQQASACLGDFDLGDGFDLNTDMIVNGTKGGSANISLDEFQTFTVSLPVTLGTGYGWYVYRLTTEGHLATFPFVAYFGCTTQQQSSQSSQTSQTLPPPQPANSTVSSNKTSATPPVANTTGSAGSKNGTVSSSGNHNTMAGRQALELHYFDAFRGGIGNLTFVYARLWELQNNSKVDANSTAVISISIRAINISDAFNSDSSASGAETPAGSTQTGQTNQTQAGQTQTKPLAQNQTTTTGTAGQTMTKPQNQTVTAGTSQNQTVGAPVMPAGSARNST
jgi:hypothetical protein